MHPTSHGRRALLLGVAGGVLALLLTACGGGSSSSSTGPSSSSGSLKRVDGRVVSSSTAEAPADSLLARLAALFGMPTAADAQVSNCTVTAPGGVTTTTGSDGRFVLQNVPIASDGSVTLTFNCPGAATGSLRLEGLPAGSVITLEVDVRPGRVTVRSRNVDASPSPSPSPKVSQKPSPSPSAKVSP